MQGDLERRSAGSYCVLIPLCVCVLCLYSFDQNTTMLGEGLNSHMSGTLDRLMGEVSEKTKSSVEEKMKNASSESLSFVQVIMNHVLKETASLWMQPRSNALARSRCSPLDTWRT